MGKANLEKAKLSEQWYGVQYGISKILKSRVNLWKNCGLHPNLKFPARNLFIPSDFTIKTENTSGTETKVEVNN